MNATNFIRKVPEKKEAANYMRAGCNLQLLGEKQIISIRKPTKIVEYITHLIVLKSVS